MASSLLLCFASPVWAAWSLILAAAAAVAVASARPNVQGGDCSASIRCGNLTISKPFRIVPDQATEGSCGLLGFQVVCENHTPYLGYQGRRHNFIQLKILDIFYGNSSLLVADMHKLVDLTNLSHIDCQYKFPTVNTSSKIAHPFSISPTNQQLILYDYTKLPKPATAAADGLVERTCGNSTL
ncbi:hypothetical protein SETIT_5G094500v2 [Setaria italica]|uniref:Wall-associated receptor kinase galacturonan-binding domain-containing protein n=1 Tax=Setaria italica TaxID=4555 RepID=A0A368R332_SETIT|nr:hypothetical protein SETIT_5G094500v2 [Setaria italica]